MIQVENVTESDVDAVVDLFREDLESLQLDQKREDLKAMLHSVFSDREGTLLWGVREKPDEPMTGVLFAHTYWSAKHGGRAIWLEQLYVRPTARRLGLGRLLVNALLDWAEVNGIRGIDLESYRLNAPASILYRSMGFRRLGRERFTLTIVEETKDEN